ncbi:hypothetical protein QBC32DRAFT_367520 [Pseudoneurospora amorphoporcata]|uniref:Uncharacterized protein n=1 Tax=Pseudoneurospora amorphoporcata TaxID=241081 RepID=A0AAN6P119_9PEZI|nr:hypothetical protein QBC32DRAFT_367520 [Pseudoneurospora amorphoporcata]
MFKDTATKPTAPTAARKEAVKIKRCCPGKAITIGPLPSISLGNRRTSVEANKKFLQHPSPASAPTTSLSRPSPPDIYKPLPPVPLFQDPMFPFPTAAFIPQSQKGPSAKGYPPAHQPPAQTQTLKQQQQETEQETEFLTLLSLLEKALRHTHYAVCGRAALYVWGYRQNPPENVSIVCPNGNEEIILSWAKTQGWTVVISGVRGCSFETPLPRKGDGKEGKVKEVTVKTAQRMGLTLGGHDDLVGKEGGTMMPVAVKGTWAEAEKKVLKTTAAVVTLPALLGMLIEGFITEVANPYHQPETEAAVRESKRRVEEAANVIFWIFSRLVERNERLSQDKVPEAFLTPFLAGWPEAHALFEELGVSTFLDQAFDRADEPQPEPEPRCSGSAARRTLDACTLAALEGLPLVPSVPPTIPPRSPKRMTPLMSSCKSKSTIALIEDEIVSWNCLSLEEAALATREDEETSSLQSAASLAASSRLSRASTAETTDLMAETAESIKAWTTACSSSSSMATSISTVPTLSVSASTTSSCFSKKSGSQLSSLSAMSGWRSPAKRAPPPWKSTWDERMVDSKGGYPEWI